MEDWLDRLLNARASAIGGVPRAGFLPVDFGGTPPIELGLGDGNRRPPPGPPVERITAALGNMGLAPAEVDAGLAAARARGGGADGAPVTSAPAILPAVEDDDCRRLWQAVLARAILDGMPSASGVDWQERIKARDFLNSPDLDLVIAAGLEPTGRAPISPARPRRPSRVRPRSSIDATLPRSPAAKAL